MHCSARRAHLSVFNRSPPGKVQLERRDKVALLRRVGSGVSSVLNGFTVQWASEGARLTTATLIPTAPLRDIRTERRGSALSDLGVETAEWRARAHSK